jgi:uncharacterized membrane protein YiaA
MKKIHGFVCVFAGTVTMLLGIFFIDKSLSSGIVYIGLSILLFISSAIVKISLRIDELENNIKNLIDSQIKKEN